LSGTNKYTKSLNGDIFVSTSLVNTTFETEHKIL